MQQAATEVAAGFRVGFGTLGFEAVAARVAAAVAVAAGVATAALAVGVRTYEWE